MTAVRFLRPERFVLLPVMKKKVVKSKDEWRAVLGDKQFHVCRLGGTEPAFSGQYHDCSTSGTYCCGCCDTPLFLSDDKFDSGTGWPSFSRPFSEDHIESHQDLSHGMTRTEVRCSACGAHLGHVFPDGPPPTELRYCINSVSLALSPSDQLLCKFN